MDLRVPVAILAAGLMAGAACAQPAAQPSDPQIAHIAYTAGQIDIAAAEQALAKSKAANVRAFAEEMVRDHKAVNDQALALVKKLGVTPQENATSAALSEQAKAKHAELAKLDGAAFDRATRSAHRKQPRPAERVLCRPRGADRGQRGVT